MKSLNKKMGFWQLVALVTGNLVGSGVFLLPSTLAQYGSISVLGWIVTTIGAVLLSLVFGQLSYKHPRTGGPHVYVEEAFGKTAGFYVAWGYWVLSWVSNAALVVATVGYLQILTGPLSPLVIFFAEALIIIVFTLINLRGIVAASQFELIITFLKILPLIIIPICALSFIQAESYMPINPTKGNVFSVINTVSLIVIWGYIGLETGTVPSGDVENARKTLPKALVTGTLIAAFIYMLGTITIMGVVPREQLLTSTAPYADVASIIFGGNWHRFIAFCAVICCLGALNGWFLIVGRIAYGAAKDGLFPKFFAKTTKSGSPKWGLILASCCSIPFAMISLKKDLITQFNFIIDVSVTLVMLIYLACMLAYFVFLRQQKTVKRKYWGLALGAMLFSIWALWAASLKMVLLSMIILLAGVPVYFWQKKQNSAAF